MRAIGFRRSSNNPSFLVTYYVGNEEVVGLQESYYGPGVERLLGLGLVWSCWSQRFPVRRGHDYHRHAISRSRRRPDLAWYCPG